MTEGLSRALSCGAVVFLGALVASGAIAQDMLRYYPEKAQRAGVEGVAVIACIGTVEGKLKDCTVTSEKPPDFGFGEAALKMAPLFKVRPAVVDGKPTDAPVSIPLTFKLLRLATGVRVDRPQAAH
jgi:TonB family protein